MNSVPASASTEAVDREAAPTPVPPRNSVAVDLLKAAGILAGAAAVDAMLKARRAERQHPPIGRFVDVDGARVHYVEKGSGPPVVLLHGNGTMVEDWVLSGLFDRLAARHRVIAIDRPGYGYSARPRTPVWTAPVQADHVRKTLAKLGVARPVVLGHSWGTLVALALAIEHPGEVAGLVLLSGYYFPSRRLDVWLLAPPGLPVIGDLMRYTVSPPLSRLLSGRVLRKAFAPNPIPLRFAQHFPLGLSLRPSQIRASAQDSGLMVPGAAALAPRYRELRSMPIVLMAGDGDEIATPKRQTLRLHRELPGSDLRVFPGLGHMLHYFVQDEIAEAVSSVARASRADLAA